MIAVDGRGDLATGTFGEMLMTYFKSRGGAGVVIDTGIRDSAAIFNEIQVPVWSTAVTTGGAGHMNLFPEDINLPIACGKVLVRPGDIIMADDGGAIVVPPRLAPKIIRDSRRARRARGVRPHEAPRRRRAQQVLPLQRRGPLANTRSGWQRRGRGVLLVSEASVGTGCLRTLCLFPY